MVQTLDLNIDPPAYAGGTDSFLRHWESFPDDVELIQRNADAFQCHAESFLPQTRTLQSRVVNLLSDFINLQSHAVTLPFPFSNLHRP
jgi:hypothetical protein